MVKTISYITNKLPAEAYLEQSSKFLMMNYFYKKFSSRCLRGSYLHICSEFALRANPTKWSDTLKQFVPAEAYLEYSSKFLMMNYFYKKFSSRCLRGSYLHIWSEFALRASPTKWSDTLKQFVGCCRRIVWVCLTIFWGWRLKG